MYDIKLVCESVTTLYFPKSSEIIFLHTTMNYKPPNDSSLWLEKQVVPFCFLFWPGLSAQLMLCLIQKSKEGIRKNLKEKRSL